jgi:fatty-acyl-CoA synthase
MTHDPQPRSSSADALMRRQTLGDALRRTAARFPGRTAIVCGETSWTYAEFDAIATRAAAGLAARGVQAGDRVAVIARNSHSFAALRFGLARLGAALVPINFMLQPAEAAHILRHCAATRLCIDSEFAALGAAAARDTSVVERIWLPPETATPQPPETVNFEEIAAGRTAFVEPGFGPEQVAQIMYTSGTEARPKGVVLTHAAVMAEYASCLADLEISETDRVLHALPMYHCAQLDVFLGPSVQAGGYNLIISAPAPERVLGLIAEHRISSFFAPPTVWISLLRSPLFDQVDLSSLHKGYYGASIMPVEVLKELQRRAPGLRLWNCYGQTEMAPMATVLKPEDQLRKPGSAGRPCLHVETRVLRDDGTDAEVGETGEIVHRSPHLMGGYLDDPGATAAAFASGWFHSGDLGVLDEEGYLTVVDRKKDMIKTGGENVASREVEEVIYGLAGVVEVAVVGLPDPRWVEAVTAVIVRRPGAGLTEDQVLAHCACLAPFKRPKRIVFAETLPKNASGKVMKRQLRQAYERD